MPEKGGVPPEILKKVKALEIQTRRLVDSRFSGKYQSLFKGQGISFSELRNYQIGDEIRFIDWHATAKTGHPLVKSFEEERELTVTLMVDISASESFGSGTISKTELAAEIAAVLGFSAIQNQDRVGLLLFSESAECYVPPKKGKKHMARLLRDIFHFEPSHKGTNISEALKYLSKVTKRRSIIFLLSDFLDYGYEDTLRTMAKQHEIVPIVLVDPKENQLPKSGLIRLEDAETGEQLVLNSYSFDIRQRFRNIILARRMEQKRLFKSCGITPILIDTSKPYTRILARYFEMRLKRRR